MAQEGHTRSMEDNSQASGMLTLLLLRQFRLELVLCEPAQCQSGA